LGASRFSLIKQSFIEGFILATTGGIIGILFSYWGNHAFTILLSNLVKGTAKIQVLSVDVKVVIFAIGVTIATGIIFGLIPVWYTTRTAVLSVLKRERDFLLSSQSRIKMSDILVGVQIAVSFVLLVVSGLFIRTVQKLEHQDLGFIPTNLLIFSVSPVKSGYTGTAFVNINQQLLQRVETIPGVESVSCSTTSLGSGFEFALPLTSPHLAQNTKLPPVRFSLVGPDFFKTMGMKILEGRGLTQSDFNGPGRFAVINETLANKVFPDGHRLGQRVVLGDFSAYEIIGVVHNVKGRHLREDLGYRIYLPYHTMPEMLAATPDGVFFEVKTRQNPISMANTIRGVAHEISPKLSLDKFITQTEQVSEAISRERVLARASSFFSFFVLLLSCVSIYAVQSHSVTVRKREVGIRVTLGARRAQILWMILRHSCSVVIMGVILGGVIALFSSKILANELYGVVPNDLISLTSAIILICIVTLSAAFLPAYRAVNVDPATTLRAE
jgi:predicted permease